MEHLKEARTRWNFYNIKIFNPVCNSKSLLGLKVGGLYIINKLLQMKQTSHLMNLDYSCFQMVKSYWLRRPFRNFRFHYSFPMLRSKVFTTALQVDMEYRIHGQAKLVFLLYFIRPGPCVILVSTINECQYSCWKFHVCCSTHHTKTSFSHSIT